MLSNDAGQPLSESHQHSTHQQLQLQQQQQQQQQQLRATEESSTLFGSSNDQSLILNQQVPLCSNNLTVQQQQQPPSGNQNCNSSGLFVKAESASGRRYRPQKYCAVCGDRAIACNFNAVTCESCKAFFRRNAFKEQRLKCLFNNRCVINRVTRRFCSKCRILKCFQIGMKREWILTDEQKQMKRVKIMQNKQLKKLSVSSVGSYGSPRPVNGVGGAHDNALDADALQLEQLDRDRRMSGSIGSRSDTSTETYGTTRSSSSTSGRPHIEMKDAETSCPAEFELDVNGGGSKLMHYCSLIPQCQYCFSKLAESHCDMDENASLEHQQQSSTTPDPLVGYQPHESGSQTSSMNCDFSVACGSSGVGSRSTLVETLATSHHSDHQSTSPTLEERRPNSNCCYLEPVASGCHQQAAQFDQFVSRQLASSAANSIEQQQQQSSQMMDTLQMSYLVPNCGAIRVDSQHQTKAEFCPQGCPILHCMCGKNT